MAHLLTALQRQAVQAMLKREMGIDQPRPFQVDAIGVARYHAVPATRTTMLMVRRTGDGKSAVPLGALRMRGGVGFSMVPLLTVGTGQAADANKMCPGIMSYHVDELSPADYNELLQVTRAPGPMRARVCSTHARMHAPVSPISALSHTSRRCSTPSSPGPTRGW